MIIKISDWPYGFKKVSFTRLQMDALAMRLKESKGNTDKLLEGHAISFDIEDAEIANEFILKASD